MIKLKGSFQTHLIPCNNLWVAGKFPNNKPDLYNQCVKQKDFETFRKLIGVGLIYKYCIGLKSLEVILQQNYLDTSRHFLSTSPKHLCRQFTIDTFFKFLAQAGNKGNRWNKKQSYRRQANTKVHRPAVWERFKIVELAKPNIFLSAMNVQHL